MMTASQRERAARVLFMAHVDREVARLSPAEKKKLDAALDRFEKSPELQKKVKDHFQRGPSAAVVRRAAAEMAREQRSAADMGTFSHAAKSGKGYTLRVTRRDGNNDMSELKIIPD